METPWKATYAFAETAHTLHLGKDNTRKTQKRTSEGNTAIAKNIALRTKNNVKRYAHTGIIGFINKRLEISIWYTSPEETRDKKS